jgi:hypothetical protein
MWGGGSHSEKSMYFSTMYSRVQKLLKKIFACRQWERLYMYEISNLNMYICGLYKKTKIHIRVSFKVCNLTVSCSNLVLTDSLGC